VRTVLPYKYIMILRTMLSPRENFDDWEWAQKAQGDSSVTGSWFEVAPETIDKTDPDCVWRRREVPVRVKRHPGSVATQRQHLAAIRLLFDHLLEKGVVELNPAARAKPPRLERGKSAHASL
jgi:hypothetical protein